MKKTNLDNKKTVILTIVAVLTLILVVIGATYAYFVAQGGSSSQADVSVKTATTDVLILSTGEEINITADQFTFGKDMGNRDGSTYAKAELRANNSTNNAKANYYVYLDIKENSFIYTTENKTAELILTVTDPDGNPVTKVNGLEYVTVNGISGFDVTDKSGLFTIVDNHEIVSTGTKIENWNVVLTLVNLDSDQSQNAGNGLKAVLEITKESKSKDSLLADLCNGKTLSDCVKLQYTGTQGENNLYLHDSTLKNGAGDGSYRYAGSSDTTNNFVCFGYDSTDGSCPDDYLYRMIGSFDDQVKLIKYDYAKASLLGTDGDYNYTYVDYEKEVNETYGTNKGTNSKSEIGTYSWNNSAGDSSTNLWSDSRLNKVNLNTNYLNNIGEKWSSKIANHTWKVGGNTWNKIGDMSASGAYQNEIVSPATNLTYAAKVGLMYVSDYGYAAASSAWTTSLTDYEDSTVLEANWMYMGLMEKTLTPEPQVYSSASTLYLNFMGGIDSEDVKSTEAIRPVIYLDKTVRYSNGEGTISAPILIK